MDGKDLQDASGMQNPGYAHMGGKEEGREGGRLLLRLRNKWLLQTRRKKKRMKAQVRMNGAKDAFIQIL